MLLRRSLILVLALVSIGVASCGDADPPTRVAAGGDPAEATTSTSAATSSTTEVASTLPAEPTPTTAAPAAPETTSTTAAPAVGPAAPSPVDGLDAAELQAALAAPLGSTARSAGPVADRVTLDDGTTVWRVRVPGDFDARSARVSISVGGRVVGEGVLAPDLAAITAVSTDGAGLTAGRPVTYQWEGGPSVAAGNLAVAR